MIGSIIYIVVLTIAFIFVNKALGYSWKVAILTPVIAQCCLGGIIFLIHYLTTAST